MAGTRKGRVFRLPARGWAGWTVLCLGILILAFTIAARGANFTVSLDRDTITLGESVTLTLTFEGGDPGNAPELPAIPNLDIGGSSGKSSQISIVNNQVSSTISYSYAIKPRQAGEIIIPAMTAKVGDETLRSQPVKLTVQKTPPIAPGQPSSPGGAFLKLIVPKTQVYVGEIVPIEIQLYVQSGKLIEMPHFKEEGFTLGKMLQPTQSQTVINGQRYNVVTFKTFVVAAKAAKLDIGPAVMSVNVPAPNSRRAFFGEFMDYQTVSLQSQPASIQALPLPKENVPANFNGAVGSFSLTVNVSPTNIAVGDPTTVKVQISGRGVVDGIALPEQPSWQHFKLYPPTSEFQANDDLGITGTKSFALTAVPDSMDVHELPPFSFSYFDPDQKAYRTLTQPAVALTVRPSAASLPVAALAPAETPQIPTRDIVHIKPRIGTLAQIQSPLLVRSWFVGLQTVPVAAWLALLIGRKQREKLANNPRLRRQRQVEQVVRSGVRELRQAANANQREAFFTTLIRLLREQLGERLDLPASAITESVLDEKLGPDRLPANTLSLLRELFQACNQARYAHQETNEQLVSLAGKAETALNELKQLKIEGEA
jgi:BatD DUF11 like domain